MREVIKRSLNRARYVLLLLLGVWFFGGILYSLLEKTSVFDGLWWGAVTGFTVGYGDFYPATNPGRVMAMFYMFFMCVLWLIFAAHVVAVVIEEKHLYTNDEQERNEAAMLEICQHLGIVPPEFRQLPDVDWWRERHSFIDDCDNGNDS